MTGRAVVGALVVVILAGTFGGAFGLYWLLDQARAGWAGLKRRLIRR